MVIPCIADLLNQPPCFPFGDFPHPEAPGAFNGRPDPSATHPASVFGGLKTRLFEGPKLSGSVWAKKRGEKQNNKRNQTNKKENRKKQRRRQKPRPRGKPGAGLGDFARRAAHGALRHGLLHRLLLTLWARVVWTPYRGPNQSRGEKKGTRFFLSFFRKSILVGEPSKTKKG